MTERQYSRLQRFVVASLVSVVVLLIASLLLGVYALADLVF